MTYRPSNGADRRFPPRGRPGEPAAPPARAGIGRLSPGQRAGLYVGVPAAALLLVCCGALAAAGVLAGDPRDTAGDPGTAAKSASVEPSGTPAAAPSTTEPSVVPTPSAPVVEKRTVTETVAIPFARRTVKDASLPEGTTRIRTRGVPGVKTVTYEVTITGGVETGKRVVRETITRKPVTEVTAVGTKPASRCHPNYGGCVPIASDVDCAGGSGDGPAYVDGPVDVRGDDVYRLDHDDDGVGCE